jgi:hypothetical protein
MSRNHLFVTPPSSPTPGRRDVAAQLFVALALLVPVSLSGCGAIDDLIDQIDHHGGGGGPSDPCATVRCAAGTHCEAQKLECTKGPCAPVAACVPDVTPPTGLTCGGIAGKACPGMGKCVDDPSDSCDPTKGGADCGGLCTCVETVLCTKGSKFDASPSVCACVPEKPVCGPVCLIYCEFGNVLDSQGCPTCACNKPTPGAVCPSDKCTGPGPKSATVKCSDGKTIGGPACVVDASGTCNWTVVVCPA